MGLTVSMRPHRDVLCGFLLCVNISGAPRLGDLGGDISSVTFYHQGKELDCRCWPRTMAGEGEVAAVMGWGARAEASSAISPGVVMCSWLMAQT